MVTETKIRQNTPATADNKTLENSPHYRTLPHNTEAEQGLLGAYWSITAPLKKSGTFSGRNIFLRPPINVLSRQLPSWRIAARRQVR